MRWRIRRSIVKYTRWNGCPCSNPIVGRTGEVCTPEARFAAREFENTLEVVEVVGVGNRESIFNFACKCRYEANIPIPARLLPLVTVDLPHSGFLLHEIAPSPLLCIILYPVLVPVRCSSNPLVLPQLVPSSICLRTRTGGVRMISLPPKRTQVRILCNKVYHPVVPFLFAIHHLCWSWSWSAIAGYNARARKSVGVGVQVNKWLFECEDDGSGLQADLGIPEWGVS
jgi:hypothetical protein